MSQIFLHFSYISAVGFHHGSVIEADRTRAEDEHILAGDEGDFRAAVHHADLPAGRANRITPDGDDQRMEPAGAAVDARYCARKPDPADGRPLRRFSTNGQGVAGIEGACPQLLRQRSGV